MSHSSSSDKHSRLLEEIEAFSRHGPPPAETPAPKPAAFQRDTLKFPDLNEPPRPTRKAHAGARAAAPAQPALTDLALTKPGSLLARLRQQAQQIQRNSEQREAANEARAFHLSAQLGAAYHYLNDVVKQLNIIRPPIGKAFAFPPDIVFSGLSWQEGSADFRLAPAASEDRLYETVLLRGLLTAPAPLRVERDALAVEALRKQLVDAGLDFTLEERKNERNLVASGSFTIPAEIKVGFMLKADFAAHRYLLRTRHLDRFGFMEFHLEAGQLTQETLDELVELMLGEENRFLRRFRRVG